MTHPGMVTSIFSLFSCMDVEGDPYLYEDLDVRCFDQVHWKYVYYIGIPSSILWLVMVPSIATFVLLKNRRKLGYPEFKSKLGFIYNGYKEKYFYWEITLVYRKIIVAFIGVFMGSGNT